MMMMNNNNNNNNNTNKSKIMMNDVDIRGITNNTNGSRSTYAINSPKRRKELRCMIQSNRSKFILNVSTSKRMYV